MDPLEIIAEARLQQAADAGFFDDLPLAGEPLPREDLTAVPAELRAGYRLLKGAGCLPEELELHRELVSLRSLLAACVPDGEDAAALRRRVAERSLRYELLTERHRRHT